MDKLQKGYELAKELYAEEHGNDKKIHVFSSDSAASGEALIAMKIRELAEEMYRQVYAVAPVLFRKAGPSCTCGACSEGKMSCGMAQEVREKYARMRAEAAR